MENAKQKQKRIELNEWFGIEWHWMKMTESNGNASGWLHAVSFDDEICAWCGKQGSTWRKHQLEDLSVSPPFFHKSDKRCNVLYLKQFSALNLSNFRNLNWMQIFIISNIGNQSQRMNRHDAQQHDNSMWLSSYFWWIPIKYKVCKWTGVRDEVEANTVLCITRTSYSNIYDVYSTNAIFMLNIEWAIQTIIIFIAFISSPSCIFPYVCVNVIVCRPLHATHP